MSRFLLTPRWLVAHAAVLAVAAACVALGLWQLDRLEQRRAYNSLLDRRFAMAPVPLDELLPPGSEPDDDAISYRRVQLHGTYDAEREVVLFGRTLDGRPGNHLLTPIVTGDDRGLVVDRGWVPIELDRPPVAEALPPAGEVALTGVLFPSEDRGASEDEPGPVSSIGSIDLARLSRQLPYRIGTLYLWLLEQEPVQSGSLPETIRLPERSEGPHFSYAVQWFIFATIALIGYGVIVRRELLGRRVRTG
jgi:cytochrome oxidase assembly protein ShyY1